MQGDYVGVFCLYFGIFGNEGFFCKECDQCEFEIDIEMYELVVCFVVMKRNLYYEWVDGEEQRKELYSCCIVECQVSIFRKLFFEQIGC